jgi:hypothetical protein
MAAADALVRTPGALNAQTAPRVTDVLRRALASETMGQPKALLGYVNEEFSVKASETVKQAGFEPIIVRTGRELLKRLNEAADIEVVIFDADLPDPGLTTLLGQLRSDVRYGRLPVYITAAHQQLDRLLAERDRLDAQLKNAAEGTRISLQQARDRLSAQIDMERTSGDAQLSRLAKMYHRVYPLPTTFLSSVDNLKPALQASLGAAVNPPLADSERKEYAEKAVRYLARAARGELPGLDIMTTSDAVYKALRDKKLTPEGQLAAVEIAGRYPGKAAQTELLRAVMDMDEKRPKEVRLAAAAELVRHIQRNSPALTDAEVAGLRDVFSKSADPAYRAAVAQVFGVLRPDAKATGDLLRGFQPMPPKAPMMP